MKTCLHCRANYSNNQFVCPQCQRSPVLINGYQSFAPALCSDTDGYDASFYEQLSVLEGKNFWFRSRNRLILWAFKHYFPTAQNFLEIGCGTGFVLSAIERANPELAVYGSEVLVKGLTLAQKRLERAELFQMDAREMPFEQEFDVIGSFDVVEHIEDDRRVLAELYRAVRNGGGVMLTVPQHQWLWSEADQWACHVRRYSAKELREKIEQAGFEIVCMTSFVSLLLPLMLISRLSAKKNYDPLAELKLPVWLNALMERVLLLEYRLIRMGVRFPAGGSLLLVAKKPNV